MHALVQSALRTRTVDVEHFLFPVEVEILRRVLVNSVWAINHDDWVKFNRDARAANRVHIATLILPYINILGASCSQAWPVWISRRQLNTVTISYVNRCRVTRCHNDAPATSNVARIQLAQKILATVACCAVPNGVPLYLYWYLTSAAFLCPTMAAQSP